MNRRSLMALALAGILSLAHPVRVDAARITLLCSNGIKAVVDALMPKFEAATGHTVTVKYDLAANIRRQVEAGDAFDLVIATPAVIDDLIKQGKLASETRTNLARVGLAIIVRQGRPRDNIRTVDAFTRALLDAKSIAYAREGASGVAFAATVQRLGIAEQVHKKSLLTESGEAVGEAVTSGKVEFGVLPVSEILPVKGAEVLARFPADIQTYIVMVGGVNARAPQRAVGEELIRFLAAPTADEVLKQYGMERVPR
jgi:molybdate transport system substrate-binding protein